MRARWPILALAFFLAAPRVASAQSKDAAIATMLFQQGRDAAKTGDYATAIAKMQESYRLDPAVGTLLNLADAHEHLGHTANAWKIWKQALDQLPATDNRRSSVKQRIAALEPRVPRLTITLAPSAPAASLVTLDDAALTANDLGAARPLDPGPHVITVTLAGREARRYEVVAADGRAEQLVVEPTPAPAVAPTIEPPPPAPHASRPSKLRIAGFAVGGVGLGSIGAAIATGLILPSRQKTIDAHCGAAVGLPADRCDAKGFDAAGSGKSLAGINTAAWILGGAAVATGVTLVIVGSVGGEKPAAAVELTVAPTLAGATLGGRF